MNNDFARFRSKIVRQVLLIAVAAPIFWLLVLYVLIDGLFQAAFAEWFVQLCQRVFHITYVDGQYMYQQLFRNNRGILLTAGFFGLLLIVFYFVLRRMTNYFTEISQGLDQLVAQSGREITLSPELDVLAAKLNQIKANLEKREREAREAEQRKNDLVVYLAHDIKTPLTAVIGYLNLLDEATDLPVEQKARYVGLTLDKAYRLEQLINEFFEITRFNLQSIVLNKESLNLPLMLRQMADEFEPLLAPSGKQIVVEAPEGLCLSADADKLARVFNNLLKNAVTYSDDNGVIEVRAGQQGPAVVVAFTNHGHPIPAAHLETIFEKFFRLDAARSSKTGGAGLGLAIAKEIVMAHGGTIHAESNERFTAFTVTLPSAAAPQG